MGDRRGLPPENGRKLAPRFRSNKLDFAGGNHDEGWDACGGRWDDGSAMEYDGSRATWWAGGPVLALHRPLHARVRGFLLLLFPLLAALLAAAGG